jgi:hypothetical protein
MTPKTPLRRWHRRGDVLLISLLILLAILLGFTLIGMILAVNENQGETVSLNAASARQAAAACLETAMDKIGLDNDYAGGETILVGDGDCLILAVVSSTNWTLRAEATVGNEISRQQVVLSDLSPVTISTWTEAASF